MFRRVGTLRRHIVQVHRSHQQGKVYSGCGKFFPSSEYWKRHMIKSKQEFFKVICQYWEQGFD